MSTTETVVYKYYHRDPQSKKRTNLKRNYGLTIEENDKVFEYQEGKCAICLRPLTIPNVDHSHATGETRGLLCWHCNNALGKFRDNIEMLFRAIEYLKRFPVVAALGGRRFGLPGRISTSIKRRKMLAKKALEAGLVEEGSYDFCCPELKSEIKNIMNSRKHRKMLEKERKSI